MRTQVDRRKYNIKYTHLLPDHFKSHHDLVDALADQEIFAALAEDGFSASINLFGSGVSFSRNAAAKKLLGPVLRNKCSENGLAILIDEAHMLYRYPDTTRLFLNEAQVLAGSNRPLLLIFAGSPNISARLTNVEATFWDRLDKIGIGLLDAEAAQNALRKPLESMGYCVAADTLKNAAEAALRYSYFLQLIGRELHRAAEAAADKLVRGNEIGDAILKLALEKFGARANTYYSGRYDEIRESGILRSAEAVARCFVSSGSKSIRTVQLEKIIGESMDPTLLGMLASHSGGIDPAAWVEAELRRVGLVWSQIGQEEFCEPGIPSLMDYILNRARA